MTAKRKSWTKNRNEGDRSWWSARQPSLVFWVGTKPAFFIGLHIFRVAYYTGRQLCLSMSDIWFVRAGRESVYADEFIQNKVVAVGWSELGEVDRLLTKANLVPLYKQAYPTQSEGKIQAAVSQIIRFMQEIKVGDTVMTHDRNKQTYYIGSITSEYQWKPEIIAELPRIREVEWKYQVPRALLSSDTKNTLGAIQTLFLIKGKPTTEIHSKQQAIQCLLYPHLHQSSLRLKSKMILSEKFVQNC
ncbi:hypothetical protein NC981_16645 [Leptolyngbya sp. DQ-M1]|uniref:restriction endonuclease n=1 Tax=Leptolyngbya sp. DQ-M1 TaxID=2933920 RepID=UPI003298E3FF